MRTIAITHRIHEANSAPFTKQEIADLLAGPFVAIGTNWRGRNDWADDARARLEFQLFEEIARDGGWVIANYEGMGAHQRLVGRIAATPSGASEWNRLRRIRLDNPRPIDAQQVGVEDLQVLPRRTIVEITDKAGSRIRDLVGG